MYESDRIVWILKDVINIPYSKKFRKLLRSTQEQYGKKKGKQVAHATAEKRGWKH